MLNTNKIQLSFFFHHDPVHKIKQIPKPNIAVTITKNYSSRSSSQFRYQNKYAVENMENGVRIKRQ